LQAQGWSLTKSASRHCAVRRFGRRANAPLEGAPLPAMGKPRRAHRLQEARKARFRARAPHEASPAPVR